MNNKIQNLILSAGISLFVSASIGAQPKQEIWYHPKTTAIKCPQGPYIRLQSGEIMAVSRFTAMFSKDEGKTWKSVEIFKKDSPYIIGNCRALLQTPKGTIILAFNNSKEGQWKWDNTLHDADHNTRLPSYVIRSTDGGRTWSRPQHLQTEWTGAMNGVLQTRDGRVVISNMMLLHGPGRHSIVTYSSTDDGKSWERSNIIDLGGSGNHDGAMEAAIIELKDGRIWMLIRTNWDYFWEAFSDDGGAFWRTIKRSPIKASASPGQLLRLADGRIALVWNQLFPEGASDYKRLGGDLNFSATPASVQRKELSISFSSDEGKSWSKPVVIGRVTKGTFTKGFGPEISYPYLLEIRPGVLWVTTMRGAYAVELKITDL